SCSFMFVYFFFSSRRRHTRFSRDWSSDVCSSDLLENCGYIFNPSVKYSPETRALYSSSENIDAHSLSCFSSKWVFLSVLRTISRSEERRVGKECRCRSSPHH